MKQQQGLTLIELVVVVAIVSILSTIAVGSFRNYSLRANRTSATTTLLQIRVEQEKFFLQNQRYANSMAEVIGAPPAGLGIALGAFGMTPGNRYAITLASPTPTTYTVTATAANAQINDVAACQIFTINDAGARTPAVASGCWR